MATMFVKHVWHVRQAVTRREVLETDQDGQDGWLPQKVANGLQNLIPNDGFGMVFDTSNSRCCENKLDIPIAILPRS